MLQVLQDLSNGKTFALEVPSPQYSKSSLQIETQVSLISAGTERMLVEFGKGNLLEKALQQPEKVNQVLQKMKTDGVAQTLDAVKSKLVQPIPMGYCNVGIVTRADTTISNFRVGDRVVSNGPHAEIINVSPNLCARIPESVSDDEAVFAVPGSIALHGVRLAEPTP